MSPSPEKRERPDDRSDDELEALFERVQGSLREEAGWKGRMRRLPLLARAGLVLGVALSTGLALGLTMRRPDWPSVSAVPYAHIAQLASALVVVALGAAVAAWPVHRPPLARVVVVGAAVAMIGVALLTAGTAQPAPEPHGLDAFGPAVRCAVLGVMAALPAALLARTVGREARGSALGALTLGAAAGYVAQTVTCPLDAPLHLGLGHAAPVALILGVASWFFVRPRRLLDPGRS